MWVLEANLVRRTRERVLARPPGACSGCEGASRRMAAFGPYTVRWSLIGIRAGIERKPAGCRSICSPKAMGIQARVPRCARRRRADRPHATKRRAFWRPWVSRRRTMPRRRALLERRKREALAADLAAGTGGQGGQESSRCRWCFLWRIENSFLVSASGGRRRARRGRRVRASAVAEARPACCGSTPGAAAAGVEPRGCPGATTR